MSVSFHYSRSVLIRFFCQFSAAVRHHLRKLEEAMCVEDRLPTVDSQSRRKSLNTKHVLQMTRDKLMCLWVMFDRTDINGRQLRHRSVFIRK